MVPTLAELEARVIARGEARIRAVVQLQDQLVRQHADTSARVRATEQTLAAIEKNLSECKARLLGALSDA
ncbi:hypothetical protein LWP59_27610 [Amycolatopsis acidiphila]|uniref:Uncharacterized protein n=1 Tax=Amycolatopsis acidiphila TaxID=715473 RepID=A0A558A131_9PSEU|nr:hypothetical protein [Amycolatopsis acidiphila]TVT17961.1 hypothetical protein FNH06_29505 [Amycolatopsis acidiphila]UIJ57861.1 hypothetical protein LWP59_27490 [Amycolatopsis acidiphila]UIJ57884.1 hypothetical protein LWP59_27610 [Amycolatopsis acidiphila]GHG71353.1 hypothetical protein GCM10017788_33210 [Amycolatopsis acidiphila]